MKIYAKSEESEIRGPNVEKVEEVTEEVLDTRNPKKGKRIAIIIGTLIIIIVVLILVF